MRPITFTSELVPRILDRSKTQTRRIMRLQLKGVEDVRFKDGIWTFAGHDEIETDGIRFTEWFSTSFPCPYGNIGDRLWVKEAFCAMPHLNAKACYRADDPRAGVRWKSSRYMPRSLSRITLTITEIRAQRLREITPLECVSEGINPNDSLRPGHRKSDAQLLSEFWRISDGIHGKLGLGRLANPWVWAITFRVLYQ